MTDGDLTMPKATGHNIVPCKSCRPFCLYIMIKFWFYQFGFLLIVTYKIYIYI